MDTLTDRIKEEAWRALRTELAGVLSLINEKIENLRGQEAEEVERIRAEDWSGVISPLLEVPSEEDVLVSEEELEFQVPDALRRCVETLREAISGRDLTALKEGVGWLYEYCEGNEVDPDGWYFAEIYASLDVLGISESSVLYAPERPPVYIPRLIITVNDELLRMIVRKPDLLFQISPRQFEEIIAEVFFKKGYDVQLTKATRDGGRDIVAIADQMGIRSKYLIECKRYSMAHKVSIAIVQRLLGVKIAEHANKGILATTSVFTRDARRFASTHLWDLDLKDHDDVLAWIRASG